jgi:hypothetical protein
MRRRARRSQAHLHAEARRLGDDEKLVLLPCRYRPPLTYFDRRRTWSSFEIGLSGGSWTDITTRLLSWKVTVNFGPQPSKAANNSVYVSSYKYSNGNPHVDFDFTISGDKSSTEWGYSDADTLLQLRLTLDSGLTPARSVVMLMDQTYIIADEGSDDLEPTLVCKTDELDVVADTGPAIFTCKTGVAAYLVASP